MTASWIRMPILALAATGALAVSAIAFAQAPPNPPSRFAGSVTINGAPAPSGASIQAKVGSANCGSAAVFIEAGQSRYVVDVPATDSGANAGCGTDGATVSFTVNGVAAAQTGTWANFKLSELNLTTGGAAATPTATAPGATVTATPRPPTTGSGSAEGGETSWLLLTVLGGIALGAGATAAAAARVRK